MATHHTGDHTMGMPIRSVKIPDELWNKIPDKNKSQYIREAIQAYGNQPYGNHTDTHTTITALKQQIEELKRDKDYFKYLALPFWKRWRLKRLNPPHNND